MKSSRLRSTTRPCGRYNLEPNSDSGINHNQLSSGNNLIQHPPPHDTRRPCGRYTTRRGRPLHTTRPCGRYNPIPIPVDGPSSNFGPNSDSGINHNQLSSGNNLIQLPPPHYTRISCGRYTTRRGRPLHTTRPCGRYNPIPIPVDGPSSNFEPNSDSGIIHNQLSSGNNLIQHPPPHYTRRPCGRYTTRRGRPLHTTRPCGRYNPIPIPVDGPSSNFEPNSDSGIIHNQLSSGNNLIQHPPPHYTRRPCGRYTTRRGRPLHTTRPCGRYNPIPIPVDGPSSNFEPNSDSGINHNQLSSGNNLIQHPPPHYTRRPCGRYTTRRGRPLHTTRPCGRYNPIPIPVDGPSSNFEPNSDSGINHNQLSSGNNLIQNPLHHYTRRLRGRYTTLRRRPLPCGSVSTLLNKWVASNPKSKNVITTTIDGLPNNVEQNSDSGVIHNRVSSGSNLIQHSPSHTNSGLVSVRAMNSDPLESAYGVEISGELLAECTKMGQNATTIQNPIVGIELVKIGEIVNSSVTTTNNSTEGKDKYENGEDGGYVNEDNCENGEEGGYVSRPSNNLEPNSDSGIKHNQLFSGNNLIQHPPSHYTPGPCGRYTTIRHRPLPCGSVSTLLNQWVSSNPKSKNVITTPIDGLPNNVEQNSDSGVNHNPVSSGSNMIEHSPSHTNSQLVSVSAMSSDAPESACGVDIFHELLAQSTTMGENATTIQNPIVGTELVKIAESVNTNSSVTTTNNSTEGNDKCENGEDGGYVSEDKCENGEEGGYVSGPSNNLQPNSDSGINHNPPFSGNNLIQHPPSHYPRRRCGRYTTLRRRPLPCSSVSTLLNQWVASNPKSKNVITTPIDGLPNNVEQNSDSGVIHNPVSSGSNMIQHSPSHTNSQLVSVRAMSSDAPESASGVEIFHELLAQSTTMSEIATTIQNPIVGTELVKIAESVNTNSSVTTTNNSTEGNDKCENGEDGCYVSEDKCENGEEGGYVSGPSNNLQPNSDSGINHNPLFSGNNLIQHPPSHYTRRRCGRYTTLRRRPLPCGSVSTLLNQWVASNPKSKNVITTPIDGLPNNVEQNSDSGVIHNPVSSGSNMIQHSPSHTNSQLVSVRAMSSDAPESASGVEIFHELLAQSTTMSEIATTIQNPIVGTELVKIGESVNTNSSATTTNNSTEGKDKCENGEDGGYVSEDNCENGEEGGYVSRPSNNLEPNSVSGINHNQLFSGNNLIQHPPSHYTRRRCGRYTTLRRRPLPCGSVSTLLNQLVASNPKSKNVITTPIDGLPNNVEQNSDSEVIHDRVSSGSNIIQHSPSHTNSQLVSVRAMSSDAPESASGVEILHELLAECTTMGQNATAIQNPIVGTELVKIAESVNTNSSVNTTNNSTEGEDKCENGEDSGYVTEDKCENGEDAGYVSGPSNNLEPNSDSGINHNQLSSGNNLIQYPPSHYTPRSCGRYTALHLRLNKWVASNPKSKNIITIPIDGPSNNLEQNSDSGVIHNCVSFGNNLIQHPPSHTNSGLVSVRAMSSDAPESASGVEISHELLAQSRTMGENATNIKNPIVGTELVKIGESVNTNSCVTTTNNSTGGEDKCENGEDGGYVTEDKCENGDDAGYVSGPSNNLEPNSDSGINHNQLSSCNNLIEHPPSHYTPSPWGHYTTLHLNQWVASNPKSNNIITIPIDGPSNKSKNIITIPIDGPSNNLEQNSDSGVIHDRVSFGNNLIQHPPSHTNSALVSVLAVSSDAPESASGVENSHELLAQSRTMGENATTIQNSIVGTELIKIGESLNTNSCVTTTNNSTEGEDKCENVEDSGFVCEDIEDIEQGAWQRVSHTSDSIKKDHDDMDDDWVVL